jgi:hypothetical protein
MRMEMTGEMRLGQLRRLVETGCYRPPPPLVAVAMLRDPWPRRMLGLGSHRERARHPSPRARSGKPVVDDRGRVERSAKHGHGLIVFAFL